MSKEIELPRIKNNTMNKVLGPISRSEMVNILQNTDIYVDTSMNDGFGLIGLEAIVSGAVCVMSDSFGIREYFSSEINGFIVSKVNDSEEYVKKITMLVKNSTLWKKMKNDPTDLFRKFDYDDRVKDFIKFLSKDRKYTAKKLDKYESKIVKKRSYMPVDCKPKGLGIVKKINMFIPFFVRKFVKKIVNW